MLVSCKSGLAFHGKHKNLFILPVNCAVMLSVHEPLCPVSRETMRRAWAGRSLGDEGRASSVVVRPRCTRASAVTASARKRRRASRPPRFVAREILRRDSAVRDDRSLWGAAPAGFVSRETSWIARPSQQKHCARRPVVIRRTDSCLPRFPWNRPVQGAPAFHMLSGPLVLG